MKSAPTSASEAEAMTCFNLEHTVCTEPFMGGEVVGAVVSLGERELR